MNLESINSSLIFLLLCCCFFQGRHNQSFEVKKKYSESKIWAVFRVSLTETSNHNFSSVETLSRLNIYLFICRDICLSVGNLLTSNDNYSSPDTTAFLQGLSLSGTVICPSGKRHPVIYRYTRWSKLTSAHFFIQLLTCWDICSPAELSALLSRKFCSLGTIIIVWRPLLTWSDICSSIEKSAYL